MKCLTAQRQIEDYLDQLLDRATIELLLEHFANCQACTQLYEQEQELRQALRNLPFEQPQAGFQQRILNGLHPGSDSSPLLSYAAGFISAAIIGVAIWISVGMNNFDSNLPNRFAADVAAVHFDVNRPRQVRLVFNVPEEVQTASLKMVFPTGFGVEGLESERILEWDTALSKGENHLVLPMVARQIGEGELVATITYGGAQKSFRVNLKSNSDSDMSQIDGASLTG
ncbi:MAG TPA: hypothetical protein DCZ03_02800 [Gammaproteobacteria bacterium]|nr:hypothetical protein [Gammaproteobacteria bacterium]